MPDKGKKEQEGEPAKKTVVKLKPITYRLELQYLGDKHVKRDTTYRCEFALDDGASPTAAAVAAGTVIKNLVSGTPTTGDADDLAAKRIADGGKNAPPSTDESRRILITDNHTVRRADKDTARNQDRADYYKDRGWLKDVVPAVPFRAIVRRFVGDIQLPVRDALKLLIEVKDPPEAIDQTDGKPKEFVKKFFKQYNHDTGTETKGDDNQPTWGEAVTVTCREHPGQAGFKATNIVKKMTHKQWATADDLVVSGDLTDSTAEATIGALLDLQEIEETLPSSAKEKIFIADFALRPFPTGGDNYRLLLALRKGTDDLRTVKENGTEVKLFDSEKKEITSPRTYVTGLFTVWKKIPFKMIVLVNTLTKTAVDWGIVKGKYRKFFIEIQPPEDAGHYTLTEDDWLKVLKARFDPSGTVSLYTGKWVASPANDYDKHFYPPFLRTQVNDGNTHPLTREIVKHACSKMTPAIKPPYPGDDEDQDEPNGYFCVFMKKLSPTDSDLGELLFDRHLNVMYAGVTSVQLARTVTHEIGHALSLRHALNRAQPYKVNTVNVNLLAHNEDSYQIIRHDPDHTPECIMGYSGNDEAEFCGICALIARFYPVTKLTDPAQFAKSAMDFYKGGKIYKSKSATEAENPPSPFELVVGSSVSLVALGPEQIYNPRWSAATNLVKAHVLLTKVPGATWTTSGVGTVTVEAHDAITWKIKGVTAGAVKVTFDLKGVELTCDLTVK